MMANLAAFYAFVFLGKNLLVDDIISLFQILKQFNTKLRETWKIKSSSSNRIKTFNQHLLRPFKDSCNDKSF